MRNTKKMYLRWNFSMNNIILYVKAMMILCVIIRTAVFPELPSESVCARRKGANFVVFIAFHNDSLIHRQTKRYCDETGVSFHCAKAWNSASSMKHTKSVFNRFEKKYSKKIILYGEGNRQTNVRGRILYICTYIVLFKTFPRGRVYV